MNMIEKIRIVDFFYYLIFIGIFYYFKGPVFLRVPILTDKLHIFDKYVDEDYNFRELIPKPFNDFW